MAKAKPKKQMPKKKNGKKGAGLAAKMNARKNSWKGY